MKRGGFLRRTKPLQSSTFGSLPRPALKRSKLRVEGISDTATTKKRIQFNVRAIVILRDKGCILRNVAGIPRCNGYTNAGELVLQADHLVTRSNASTFGDTRLIVCLCKGHHGWKSLGSNLRKAEYDRIVKTLLPPARISLWERAEAELWQAHPTRIHDWRMQEIALQQELATLQKSHATPDH